MADTDSPPMGEQISSTIKLTGRLISAAYQYRWGIDEAPDELLKLINALQTIGTTLSGLRNCLIVVPELGSSVFQELNARTGPFAECAAELGRLWLKIGSDEGVGKDTGRLSAMFEKGHILPYLRQLEKFQKVFALALQLLLDRSKLSEAMVGYIHDAASEKESLGRDNPSIRAAQDLKKKKKDLEWLYSKDYESGFLGVQERGAQGTGEWLQQSPIFQNWMKAKPGFLHLWGRAIGGAGKTHISAKIIHHIQALAKTQKYAVAYFFFAHMEPGRTNPKDVLRCLILQLACQAQYFASVSRVLNLRLVEQQLPPNFEKLSRTLIETSKLFDRVFLVFDGLDEYEHREDVLTLFPTLATAKVSVFFTSHPQGANRQHWLITAAKIDLSARAEDIKIYIQQRIESSPCAKTLLEEGPNRDKLVTKLTECANGMFLFVHLVIRSLLQQPTVNDIFNELQTLKDISPHGDRYESMYSFTINTIRTQNKNRAALALKILLWVVKAQRTLTVGELREALAVKENTYELDKLDLCNKQTMLDVCADLITIDESSGKVRLIHPTARASILKILPSNADYQLAVACITYISYNTFSKRASSWGNAPQQSFEDRLATHPFYRYAAKHLSAHVYACGLALTTEALMRSTWNSGCMESYFQVHKQYIHEEDKKTLPLRFAVHIGHLPLIRRLLEKGSDLLTRDDDVRTALHWAVLRNHLEIVQLLLGRWRPRDRSEGAWGNDGLWDSHEKGKPLLHRAARSGFKDIVKLLLDRGADILGTGEGGQTALHEAAKGGHDDVVALLLQNGANSCSTEEISQTALHVAAEAGHLGIVTQLIHYRNDTPTKTIPKLWGVRHTNERCDVSAKDGEYVTPLHLAALGSHTEIVRLLLEEGANSSAADHRGETVLHQAARGGDTGSVQLLLDHGADALSKTEDEITVLHRAAARGYTDMIEILLDKGADISPSIDRTALEGALEAGFEGAVQLLLSRGAAMPTPANLNQMIADAARIGDDGLVELLLNYGANPSGTPLIDAAEYGHSDVVNLLLDDGANVLSGQDNNRTVLQVAAKRGHQEVVKLVLEKGAEIPAASEANQMLVEAAEAGHRAIVELLLNHGINTCGDALYEAAANGHTDIVGFLLDRGTDIHFRHSKNQTALHIAVYNGHQNVVELLLLHGADIHARGENQQTALHQAAYGERSNGHEGIVLLLLKAGIDVAAKDKFGRTALILASKGGPAEVVRVLITNGADVLTQEQNGWTALHNAANRGHVEIVRLLLNHGAQSTIRNANDQTALVLAASKGHKQVLYAILPDSHISEVPEDVHTAFFLAAVNGHDQAASLLMSRGAYVHTKDKEGRTAFILAVEKGHGKVLQTLLSHHADIAEKTKDGKTALFVAAREGHIDVVRILLENGADVSELNEDGQTALFMAAEGRHREIFNLLIEKGANKSLLDRHRNMASIEEGYNGYDNDYDNDHDTDYEPWYPHGW